jgi:hypothetical protein
VGSICGGGLKVLKSKTICANPPREAFVAALQRSIELVHAIVKS